MVKGRSVAFVRKCCLQLLDQLLKFLAHDTGLLVASDPSLAILCVMHKRIRSYLSNIVQLYPLMHIHAAASRRNTPAHGAGGRSRCRQIVARYRGTITMRLW